MSLLQSSPLEEIQIDETFHLALEASIARDSFYHFMRMAWKEIEFDTPFQDNWHIQTICDYLQSLHDGKIPSRNLMINVPSGYMKSLLVNVFFPAWVWTKKAKTRFLCYSYSGELTIRDSMKCRNLIGSEWYQARFPLEIDPKNDQKDSFNNIKGGYRYCFGMNGSLGGHRGDYILIDDPLEMSKADSEAERKRTNNAYDTAIASRASNPKTVRRVIIMQRLHEDDLCGHVLEKTEKWEQLILPTEFDGERFVSSIGFVDPRKEIGELLWEARFDRVYTDYQKSILGSRGTAGQLQQRPAPLSGNTFKKEWFAERHNGAGVVQYYISADTASSVGANAARSSIVVGGMTADDILVPVYVWADKVEFPQLIDKLIEICQMYKEEKVADIVIEAKANGISAMQTLRQSAPEWIARRITSYSPKIGKDERGAVASTWCENKCVQLPAHDLNNEWIKLLEDELFTFPNSKYKDMVDAFVQLIFWVENILSEGLHRRMTGA